MRRRTLLQILASSVPVLPVTRVRLDAQLRTLTPEAIATLQEVAATVLPASLGARQDLADRRSLRRLDQRLPGRHRRCSTATATRGW